MIRLALPLVAFSLIGCTPLAQDAAALPPSPTACGSEKVAEFIGKKRTDGVSTEIAKRSGATNIRWISPGMAVTQDYREGRLNVDIDDQGVITAVRCG